MKSLIGLIFIPALITAQEQYEIDLPAQQEQFLRQPEPIKAPTAEQAFQRCRSEGCRLAERQIDFSESVRGIQLDP